MAEEMVADAAAEAVAYEAEEIMAEEMVADAATEAVDALEVMAEVETIRAQLGLPAGRPLVETVDKAVQELGLSEDVKGQNLVQTINACLNKMGSEIYLTVPASIEEEMVTDAAVVADAAAAMTVAADEATEAVADEVEEMEATEADMTADATAEVAADEAAEVDTAVDEAVWLTQQEAPSGEVDEAVWFTQQEASSGEMEPEVELVIASTLAGSQKGFMDGSASNANFYNPRGVAIDRAGNIVVADAINHCIRKLAPDGTVSTLAGSCAQEAGFVDGPAGDARFNSPCGVAVDASSNVLVADYNNHCIRKVSPDGTVSTLAGSREEMKGFADGPGGEALFSYPCGVAVDASSNVLVADLNNHCIRKVSPDGTVSTLAGSREQIEGFADGRASDALFQFPEGVAVDKEGNVVVADKLNHCIRKVAPDGTVSTLAGSGVQGAGFADGPAGDARFFYPCGVAVDAASNVIVGDTYNHCIRKVSLDGTVSTLAGSREEAEGFADGPGGEALFSYPCGVGIDAEGNVVVGDASNHRIRLLTNCALGPGQGLPRWPVGPASVASDLLLALEDEEFADTTFDVEGTFIKAHRAVLVVRSEYFRSMLKSGGRTAQPGAVIPIRGTSPAAFRKLLAFLYSDCPCPEDRTHAASPPCNPVASQYPHKSANENLCSHACTALELDDEVVIDVMRKAREYDLSRAYNMCMQYCSQAAQSSNAILWLLSADAFQLAELRAEMLMYVKRNFRVIREEAPETLAALRANPDVMLEVMDVL